MRCGRWRFAHSESSNFVLSWCMSGNCKLSSQPLPWALKYFSTLTWETLSQKDMFRLPAFPVLGLSAETANKWLLNTCQTAITFSPQFIIMQNRYSVVNPWFIIMPNQCSVAGNVLFIMGHIQITWMWSCGDTHQLICQKLPHEGAICHTSNM